MSRMDRILLGSFYRIEKFTPVILHFIPYCPACPFLIMKRVECMLPGKSRRQPNEADMEANEGRATFKSENKEMTASVHIMCIKEANYE